MAAFRGRPSRTGAAAEWREPRITFVDPPTPAAQATIMWAVDRFRDAGLQLPDLAISFPTWCSGKAALYHVGPGLDRVLSVDQRTVVHEFAHAWDDIRELSTAKRS